MSAADGDGFVERPAFAWARSLVSLAAESATALEDGFCYFRGGFSDCRNLEPDAGRGDSALAIYSQQRCFQWLHGSPPDLGGHAAGHPRATRLAALRRKENFSMNSNPSLDLILHNGKITTLDPKHPEATRLAVKDGRIVGIDDADLQPGPNTVVIDLNDRRVIPGLNDSHLHVIRGELN